MAAEPKHRAVIFLIVLGLILWGAYMTLGVTGQFTQAELRDPRKSVVVLAAMGLFLLLWWIAYRTNPRRGATEYGPYSQLAETRSAETLSRSGIVAVGSAIVASSLWLIAIVTWQQVDLRITTIMGWLAALGFVGTASSAMIALSDRRPVRGHMSLGLCGLVATGMALYSFFVRMGGK